MGVPKFFRWLSERYPLITVPIEAPFTPVFDNLYLDMNGIIHNCTHPEWNDNVLNRLSEKEMIIQIFHYIDRLFHAVKPQKLIYLAIDGVAPRAKMNQQRQRRLRTAQEAKEALEKAALENGGQVPETDNMFDSNCITPGTEFMAKLSEYLKYFIRKKIKEDSAWKKVKVILSGHEVPGEGEHKIMEFIRRQKMLPDHDPNTRHCLYGLDADLIMLALVSHEPHFALLREEVTFGRRKKKPADTPPKFQLLFVNLLREYLDEEFKTELPFGYDLERVIDDFILFCFFVGNDFLPNLPYMDIADGALDKMFEIYKEILPTLGGYITERGEINWERCEKFLKQIAKYEQDMLATMPPLHLEVLEQSLQSDSEEEEGTRPPASEEDISKFNAWQKKMKEKSLRASDDNASFTAAAAAASAPTASEDNGNSDEVEDALAELDDETVVFEGEQLKTKQDQEFDFGAMSAASEKFAEEQRNKALRDAKEEEEEEEDDDDSWKNWYYRDKFRVGLENEEYHKQLRKSYIEGLVWVLRYYYRGCCSWNWFFPFHYAPLCSDLVNLSSYELKFDLGTPFYPFQQLMGVLPARSKTLLPLPYQELMTRADSPIIDFYPEEFKIDMNGKRNAWEAIALIPFIDEKRLLDAMAKVDKNRLTESEKKRDSFGQAYLFEFDPTNESVFPSPMPGIFADLNPTLVAQRDFHLPEWGPEGYITPHLLPNAKFGLQSQPGFPTLQSLRHTSFLAYAGLSVFGTSSRKQSLLLKLLPPEGCEPKEVVKEIKTEASEASHVWLGPPGSTPPSGVLTKAQQPGDDVDAVTIGHELLGKTVYVDWPYLKEALVLGVSDGDCRTSQAQGTVKHLMADAGAWYKESKYQKNHYKSKKGLDIGEVKVLLHVQVLRAMKIKKDGSRIKVWRSADEIFPLQTIVRQHYAPDPRLEEQPAPSLDESFPIGQRIVYVEPGPYFGALGKVVEHVASDPEEEPVVRVEVEVPPPAPSFGRRIALQMQENFYHLSEVSRRLGISPKVLSKITASVYAHHQTRKINIGLRIKFTRKGQQMLGYTQRIETPGQGGISRGYWMYSAKAMELVSQFMNKFPDLFDALEADEAQEIEVFSPEMLFTGGNASERLAEVEEWLKHLETNNLRRVPIGSKAMSKEAVKAVEEESNRYMAFVNSEGRKKKTQIIETPISSLLTPLSDVPATEEESWPTDIALGERVMNLLDNGPIPFGLKGTVTGVVGNLLEVVFDEEFLGGTNLGNRCSDLRGQQHIPPTTVLNLGRVSPPNKRGIRNSGPQQNPWHKNDRFDRPERPHYGNNRPTAPIGADQGGQHLSPNYQQHSQTARAQRPIAERNTSALPRQNPDNRNIRKSGDKVAYRPKHNQGDSAMPNPTGGSTNDTASSAHPQKKRERLRKSDSTQAAHSVSSAASTEANGQSEAAAAAEVGEVVEYMKKLQLQTSSPSTDSTKPAEGKPRKERRRGGKKVLGQVGAAQEQVGVHAAAAGVQKPVTPVAPVIPAAAAQAPGYPVYYYQPAPGYPPQPYIVPQPFPGAPAASLYGAATPGVAGVPGVPLPAGPTTTVSIPGLPVPLQVPLQPAMAAPLNWQQQQQQPHLQQDAAAVTADGSGAKKPRGRGGRGRGGRGGRGGHAGASDHQGQAQWKPKASADAEAAGEKQQHPSRGPRRGGRGRNRGPAVGAADEAAASGDQQTPKDQKDQLTWQQRKMLL